MMMMMKTDLFKRVVSFGWSKLNQPCHGVKPCQKSSIIPSSVVVKSLSTVVEEGGSAPPSRGPSIVRLDHRGFIKIVGDQGPNFLNGLITADIHEKRPASGSLYTMFLNVQGRVLYDVIIHSCSNHSDGGGESSLLLECDINVTEELRSHLRKYKLRKKISVEDVTSEYDLYALLGFSSSEDASSCINVNHRGSLVCSTSDPRLPIFGSRLVFRHPTTTDESTLFDNVTHSNLEHYHVRRLKLGIPEGVEELPPGRALPLESNLDLMRGVSFDKGCYLGQELTARSYHVGVVRKRLLPLELPRNISLDELKSDKVTSCSGERAGALRNIIDRYGIGLIRLKFSGADLTVKTAENEDIVVRSSIPEWWPEGLVGKSTVT